MAETFTTDNVFNLPSTEDMETWRTVPQFMDWTDRIFKGVSKAPDEVQKAFRMNSSLAKKLREEFLPFWVFVQNELPRNDSVKIRARCESERLRDFEIRSINLECPEQIQRVEITYAVGDKAQGKVENERMKVFNDQEPGRRRVPAYSDPLPLRTIDCTGPFHRTADVLEDVSSRIAYAIQNKVSKYSNSYWDQRQDDLPGVWLLVTFDDMPSWEQDKYNVIAQDAEKTMLDISLGKEAVPFSRVWIVGRSSRHWCRLIYQKDEQVLLT